MDSAVLASKPEKTMRKTFIESNEASTLAEAEAIAPWAAEIIEVDGGWMAFESVGDAEVFKAQV